MYSNKLSVAGWMFIVSSALLAALSLYASADEQTTKLNPEQKQVFKNLDTNHDSKVSVSEAENNTMLLNEFNDLDKDNNKVIDESEFSAFEPVQRYEPPDIDEDSPEIGAAPND
jgi:hypothetical protein